MSTYSLRFGADLRQQLQDRAQRSGLPERTLAQRYVQEGLRRDAHPLVHFVDGPAGRRARLLGRGLDVWEVVATLQDNAGSVSTAADYLGAPPGLVEAAALYYAEYREEIDAQIAGNELEYERGRAAAEAATRAFQA